MSFFEKLPIDIDQRFNNCQTIVMAKCPMSAAAVKYIDSVDIVINFFEEDGATENRKLGRASKIENQIRIGYNRQLSPQDFFERIAHETKHRHQTNAQPQLVEWTQFASDAQRSLKEQAYQMEPLYRLPSIANSALVNVVAELDAHMYGILASLEYRIATDTNTTPHKEVTQSLLDEMYKTFVDEKDLHADWAKKEILAIRKYVALLAVVREEFGVCPSVKWTPVENYILQNMTGGFWKEAQLTSPIATRQGDNDISKLRQDIMGNQLCGTVMDEAMSVFAGNVPRSLLQAMKLGHGS